MTFLFELPGIYLSVRLLCACGDDGHRIPFWVCLRFLGWNILNLRTSITAFTLYAVRPIVLWGEK